MRNKENPFKFGAIVEDEYFTDRVQEVAYIRQFVESANHLVLISPRRFGKSSVVAKAVKQSGREHITLNLQSVTSVMDFAEKLLREYFKQHPVERIKHLITHFRVIPSVSTNPMTGEMSVSFQPGGDGAVMLEDVLLLLEKAYTSKKRLIVVLDEFQEIRDISPKLEKQLRSIMQTQQHINYILLGSQESMMADIFEDKKSPFYHFGELMRLEKLPRDDFHNYLSERLKGVFPGKCNEIADRILDYTGCHPYYSQQLAANVWQVGVLLPDTADAVQTAIDNIVKAHGLDYERLWMKFNRTNRWILQQLARGTSLQTGEHRTSTVYSALKRLQKEGYVIYSDHYELEDPFFRQWIWEEQK
ncbi:MAG: ATP-binding protein [Victivallales bacterium]|nr:ATP-binding protein [Victivallales bacterium]